MQGKNNGIIIGVLVGLLVAAVLVAVLSFLGILRLGNR